MPRPDVVEMHDVTARDPKLLVHLKATRNTVCDFAMFTHAVFVVNGASLQLELVANDLCPN